MRSEEATKKLEPLGKDRWKYDTYRIEADNYGYIIAHEDYDGPEDNRCGSALSLADAIRTAKQFIEWDEDER